MAGTTSVYDMEMRRLDQEIEKSRKQFYTTLMEKKRRVKRKWLEISAMTNAHLLQTLPYRAMLGHVAKIAEERDKYISELGTTQEPIQNITDNDEGTRHDTGSDNGAKDSEQIEQCQPDSRTAKDEAIQTEESSFLSQS